MTVEPVISLAPDAAASCPPEPVFPTIDLPALLQFAVDEACRLLRVDVAFIYLVEEGGATARWTYDSGIEDEETWREVRDWVVPIGSGITGIAIETGQLQVTEDWLADDRFFDRAYRRAREETLHLRSVVVAPMLGQFGALGALGAFDRASRTFSQSERALMRALAGHAALAIENARLNRDLLASEARLRYLLEHSLDGIWSADRDGRFTWVSDSCEAMVGWCADELIGRTARLILDEDSWAEAQRRAAELEADPGLQQLYRITLVHRDGRRIPAEVKQSGIVTDGRFGGTHGSIRDMTEHDALAEELRLQAAELAGSRERAHLAQELHDSVTQALFGMTLTTRSAEMLLARNPEAAKAKLQELRELAHDALAEMRALIFELRPGSLAEEGLTEALRKHVAAVQGRTGLAVVVETGAVPRLPLEVEDGLYRIAQEALHNVVKHASARTARVVVRPEAGRVVLEIDDDGVGFDPSLVGRGHLGLAGIRSRADAMHASLDVRTGPGRGTMIRVGVEA